MRFVERVVGLRQGRMVYDGPPEQLSAERLTEIFGEEDWTGTAHEESEQQPPRPERPK